MCVDTGVSAVHSEFVHFAVQVFHFKNKETELVFPENPKKMVKSLIMVHSCTFIQNNPAS